MAIFGAKKRVDELEEMNQGLQDANQALREQLDRLGALDQFQIAAEKQRLEQAVTELQTAHVHLQSEIVETREQAILQEVGVYSYRHPLEDAEAYKSRLADLRANIKQMAKVGGGAVMATTSWTVNNSKTQGTRMIKDFSKLMLRAYNAEADNCVRTLKPYSLDAAIKRLAKAGETIAKLGKTMDIRISPQYHHLRVYELELTADYLAKVAEQKEHERAERERLREEQTAQREYERQQAKLEKERAHYEAARQAMASQGNETGAADAQAKLGEIQDAIEGVRERAANTRAGYVYVISNIGSLGPDIVKIGMTRRLEPRDRIRELGDASVPFRYDTHALIFSEDAVGLENALHKEFADGRLNLVNFQREFFRVKPSEVKDALAKFAGELLHFVDEPEAVEWHQSEASRSTAEHTVATPTSPPAQVVVPPQPDVPPPPVPTPSDV
ncbi:MAG: DUF4041 domain-containing protein [Actinomycetota bacterium]